MRCGLGVIVVVAACGRFGFDATRNGDAATSGDDAIDAPITTGASRIFAYADRTCAIVRGAAYCWGDNNSDSLIDTGNTKATLFTPTLAPIAGTVTQISIGATHACYLAGGKLACVGDTIASPNLRGGTVKYVASGKNFTCAIADKVYCWGANDVGQLAVGDTGVHDTPTLTLIDPSITALTLGDDHGCTLEATKARCWGHNDNGTLGTGSFTPDHVTTPVDVLSTSALPHIAGWHACALSTTGKVTCWGRGDHGELGNSTMADSSVPSGVPSLSTVTSLAVGGGPSDFDATCAIAGGVVWCWGAGMYGRLGQASASDSSVPVVITGLPVGAIEVAMGYDHACARYPDGKVRCWGRGDSGQLGDGLGIGHPYPVEIVLP